MRRIKTVSEASVGDTSEVDPKLFFMSVIPFMRFMYSSDASLADEEVKSRHEDYEGLKIIKKNQAFFMFLTASCLSCVPCG